MEKHWEEETSSLSHSYLSRDSHSRGNYNCNLNAASDLHPAIGSRSAKNKVFQKYPFMQMQDPSIFFRTPGLWETDFDYGVRRSRYICTSLHYCACPLSLIPIVGSYIGHTGAPGHTHYVWIFRSVSSVEDPISLALFPFSMVWASLVSSLKP